MSLYINKLSIKRSKVGKELVLSIEPCATSVCRLIQTVKKLYPWLYHRHVNLGKKIIERYHL